MPTIDIRQSLEPLQLQAGEESVVVAAFTVCLDSTCNHATDTCAHVQQAPRYVSGFILKQQGVEVVSTPSDSFSVGKEENKTTKHTATDAHFKLVRPPPSKVPSTTLYPIEGLQWRFLPAQLSSLPFLSGTEAPYAEVISKFIRGSPKSDALCAELSNLSYVIWNQTLAPALEQKISTASPDGPLFYLRLSSQLLKSQIKDAESLPVFALVVIHQCCRDDRCPLRDSCKKASHSQDRGIVYLERQDLQLGLKWKNTVEWHAISDFASYVTQLWPGATAYNPDSSFYNLSQRKRKRDRPESDAAASIEREDKSKRQATEKDVSSVGQGDLSPHEFHGQMPSIPSGSDTECDRTSDSWLSASGDLYNLFQESH